MFKKLVQKIILAKNYNEAFIPADIAFQNDKISWKELEIISQLCEKCFPND